MPWIVLSISFLPILHSPQVPLPHFIFPYIILISNQKVSLVGQIWNWVIVIKSG